jgi:Domain of unknown function (DUF4129)
VSGVRRVGRVRPGRVTRLGAVGRVRPGRVARLGAVGRVRAGRVTRLVAVFGAVGRVRPGRGWLVAVLAAVLLVPAAAARADAVSGAELRALAARAVDDPDALMRLARVDSVDGRRADLATALEGAGGAQLRARLALLAQGAPVRGGDADAAREQAREIVSGRRFSPPEVPGPFRGVLERLADWLAPVLDLIPALDDLIPGGRPVVWAVLVLLVGGVAALLAGRALRRRAARHPRGAITGPAGIAEDPDALERRAREAAARGDNELALRLGFRAGLARLDRRGVIELRPSLSTGEVARALGSPQFDRAAARFDEVVYGRRPAAAHDVDDAREAWSAVLEERRAA